MIPYYIYTSFIFDTFLYSSILNILFYMSKKAILSHATKTKSVQLTGAAARSDQKLKIAPCSPSYVRVADEKDDQISVPFKK